MKIKITANSCGYSIYPAGTDLNINKELNSIRDVYISKNGYIYYTIYGSTKLYSDNFIDKAVITKIKTK